MSFSTVRIASSHAGDKLARGKLSCTLRNCERAYLPDAYSCLQNGYVRPLREEGTYRFLARTRQSEGA